MIRNYRDLRVWQRAVDLSIESYRITKRFPKDELYGLVSQIRRSAVSVAANIAEGHGRKHLGDYLHHLSVASGSLMELETHVLIAERLRYISRQEFEGLLASAADINKMLSGLRAKLRQSASTNPNTEHRTPNT